MTRHVFRVIIRGKFDRLGDADRAALLDRLGRADDQDVTGSPFSEEGTFVYDETLSWFTFRCQVSADAAGGEAAAQQEAIALLEAHGYGFRDPRPAMTNMSTIPIRRKGRRVS
ncbi:MULTISPECIES: DUF6204 family protein [Streptosporangium]|uniref:Uncharacterized protein n=1 Tax=Streptosporangium brasiliense TaxID=47480 RepID=A0ABT9R7N2_9ACTN|nr:DUF6204 family protein [Streptosporangium brasiliense]MDP9864814.1 hypothetical protein [Streptosporangium brasiliense]